MESLCPRNVSLSCFVCGLAHTSDQACCINLPAIHTRVNSVVLLACLLVQFDPKMIVYLTSSARRRYRFWRDSGYFVGAMTSGAMADAFGIPGTVLAVAIMVLGTTVLVQRLLPAGRRQ